MIPIVLIFIAVGVFAAAGSPREVHAPVVPPPLAPPGPIAVLGECVRVGQRPPPEVIICAIAEAEAIGRDDLAHDIVQVFVAPVVYAHEFRFARNGNPAPVAAPAPRSVERSMRPHDMDAQIQAALNADPEGFVRQAATDPNLAAIADAAGVDREQMNAAAVATAMSAVHAAAIAEQAAQAVQASQAVHVGAVPAMAMSRVTAAPPPVMHERSPIDGIAPEEWSRFVERLAREAPVYESGRHVGQYRQRRERLAELGIDPSTVLGSPHAQREAIDADLADACHHARESGLANEHVGRLLRVPGHDAATPVSLSGVLGVIQAAGLEGAVGWLENPADRRRFPHTTQAFLRTNGVF